MTDKILKRLQERKIAGNARSLTSNNHLIDFVSNDYLGLSRSSELHDRILSYDYNSIVNKNGSSGSRLLAGNFPEYIALEKKLANVFQAESALLFNSGYAANMALVSSIPQKGDTILYDSLSHVCLKEGAWLSKASSISFRHNDVPDLEQKLKRAEGDVFIVIESVYSMDGDIAPIKEITKLAKKHNANLIIDEAHSTGVFGKNGSGFVCSINEHDNFLARVYTFGKGMGVHGACVCGSKELIEYLINFGRSFIYTTALPIHSIFSIDASFDYLKENIYLQERLAERIVYFNNLYNTRMKGIEGVVKPFSNTAIQPVIIPGNEKIKNVASNLQKEGMDVRAILSPTVKSGTERLRISLHAHNSEKEIDKLLDALTRSFNINF